MEQIASLNKLRISLAKIKLVPDYRYLQRLITELHFAHERFRITGEVLTLSDEKNLWMAAHYLFTALSNSHSQNEIAKETLEDGFAISGLIFELLGRYASSRGDSDLAQDCYLNAAFANTFSAYEANATVLAKRHFKNRSLSHMVDYSSNLSDYGMNMVFALLARRFFWIRSEGRVFSRILELRDNTAVLANGRYSKMNTFWILTCKAIASFSNFMISGEEDMRQTALSDLHSSRELALENDMLFEHWLASRVLDCVRCMTLRSTWRVLSAQGFSRRYISTLTNLPWNPVHELWQSQIVALTELDDPDTAESVSFLSEQVKRLMVSMPTSAGKTLVAEMAIVNELEGKTNAKCVYIAPNRALVYEIESKLHKRLRLLGYHVSSVGGGFEVDIANPNYLKNNIDVAILTPEKFDYLLRRRDPFIDNLHLVIFDEMHKVGEGYRGWFLESLITWVLLKPELQDVKLIFMSAVLPHSQQPLIRMWLGKRKQIPILSNDWSPTRQLIGILKFEKLKPKWKYPIDQDEHGNSCYYGERADLSFKYDISPGYRTLEGIYYLRFWVNKSYKCVKRDKETRFDRCYQLIVRLGSDESTLVYFQQKVDLIRFCSHAREYLELVENEDLVRLTNYISQRLGPSFPLTRSLPYGVAYHHGDLPFDVRLEIERAYRDKVVRILACTTTLAEGVNLPIQTFILGYHRTFGGYHLSVRDFKNIIGRAGRALIETEGKIIAIRHPEFCTDEKKLEAFEKLIRLEETDLLIESELVFKQDQDIDVADELNALANAIQDEQSLAQQEYSEELADRIQRLQVFIFSLYEDGVITDNLDSLEDALQNTLCFQGDLSRDLRNSIIHLGESFHGVCKSMKPPRLRRFNASGLRYRSNSLLEELSLQIWQRAEGLSLSEYSFQNLITIEGLRFILSSIQEAQPRRKEYSGSYYRVIQQLDHYHTLVDWLSGTVFAAIRDQYFSEILDIAKRTQVCQSYISKQLVYKLPWVLSGLQCHVEPLGNRTLSFWLSTLPAQVKYGVNTPEAVYLSSIGVHSRFLAIALGRLYREEHGTVSEDEWESLGDWFRSLSPFYLRSMLPDLSELAVRQVVQRSNAFRLPSYHIRREGRVIFNVAGWQYYDGEEILGKLVEKVIGIDKPEVDLRLEPGNLYDEYAIEVYWHGYKLGYVPRRYNEEITLLIVSGEDLRAKIISIGSQDPSGRRSVSVRVELFTEER